jgi:holo-[acyl-carrier protein] synthase
MTAGIEFPRGLAQDVLAMCQTRAAQGDVCKIGVDVVSVAWFKRQIAKGPDSAFVRRAFTDGERGYCAGRPERLAVRWAAKEAVAKAIGTGFRGLRPGDIEVIHHHNGEPSLSPAAQSVWPHEAHRWNWALTLCHEGDAALAVAVAILPCDLTANPLLS